MSVHLNDDAAIEPIIYIYYIRAKCTDEKFHFGGSRKETKCKRTKIRKTLSVRNETSSNRYLIATARCGAVYWIYNVCMDQENDEVSSPVIIFVS